MGTPASFGDVKLSSLIKPGRTVTFLRPGTSVAEALTLLGKAKVLSAPVLDEGESMKLSGWLDMQTILRGLLAQLKEKHGKLPTAMLLLVKELELHSPLFATKTVGSVCPPPSLAAQASGNVQDRALIFESEVDKMSVLQLVRDKFLTGAGAGASTHVHRCAIMNSEGEITAIISQLDVVRYLSAHPHLMQALADKPVSEVQGLVSRPVLSVDANTPVMLAFDTMLKAGVSAAPVVSPQTGELVANISMSDLRCIQSKHLGSMGLPVAEFLALMHKTAYLGYSQRTSDSGTGAAGGSAPNSPTPHFSNNPVAFRPEGLLRGPEDPQASAGENVRLITAKPSSKFGEVIHMLSSNAVHRVYVLDELKLPAPHVSGIISLSDVLRVVVRHSSQA